MQFADRIWPESREGHQQVIARQHVDRVELDRPEAVQQFHARQSGAAEKLRAQRQPTSLCR